MLFQQGSKGALRDLDYINPRPPRASCALPPDVRAKLRLVTKNRSSSEPPQAAHGRPEASCFYAGAANADPKVGQSGAGTNWHNPNGHAFIRKGSGVAMSQRASGHARATGQCAQLIALQSQDPSDGAAAVNPGSRAASRTSTRNPSRESRPGSGGRRVVREAGVPVSRRPPQPPSR